MTRYCGIDYGTKRIGLAIGDDISRIASPAGTLMPSGNVEEHVEKVWATAREYEIDAFVVGLPLNMDDSEGPQARIARTFGASLSRLSGKAVHYFDERLSSVEARELLQPAELTRKKRKAVQDSVAATVLLQGFLDQGKAE